MRSKLYYIVVVDIILLLLLLYRIRDEHNKSFRYPFSTRHPFLSPPIAVVYRLTRSTVASRYRHRRRVCALGLEYIGLVCVCVCVCLSCCVRVRVSVYWPERKSARSTIQYEGVGPMTGAIFFTSAHRRNVLLISHHYPSAVTSSSLFILTHRYRSEQRRRRRMTPTNWLEQSRSSRLLRALYAMDACIRTHPDERRIAHAHLYAQPAGTILSKLI